MLVAPKRLATCTLILNIKRSGAVGWTGRAIISVR
jgi:hypothetical protein